TFRCAIDSSLPADFSACTNPLTTAVLADGSHTFYVVQIDLAGNASAATTYGPWTIDTTGPGAPTITTGPDPVTSSTTATFTVTSTEPGVTFQCDLDGAGFVACASPDTLVSLTAGIHIFSVRAVDGVGNVGDAATYNWTIGAVGGGG